jgi:hypothetical protein
MSKPHRIAERDFSAGTRLPLSQAPLLQAKRNLRCVYTGLSTGAPVANRRQRQRIANATQCTLYPMIVRTKASGHLLSKRSRLCSYARPAYKFFDYKTREVKKGGLGKRHCLTTGRRSCAAWLFLTRSFVSKSLSALTFFGYFFVSRQKSIRGPGQRPGV